MARSNAWINGIVRIGINICCNINKIGCDRGGGDWNVVKEILEKIEKECHVIFVAYKLEG